MEKRNRGTPEQGNHPLEDRMETQKKRQSGCWCRTCPEDSVQVLSVIRPLIRYLCTLKNPGGNALCLQGRSTDKSKVLRKSRKDSVERWSLPLGVNNTQKGGRTLNTPSNFYREVTGMQNWAIRKHNRFWKSNK